jgi:hypothetical protein
MPPPRGAALATGNNPASSYLLINRKVCGTEAGGAVSGVRLLSFRPRLAASVISPLHFANPSPPSGWVEDLHLQAVDHARHMKKATG